MIPVVIFWKEYMAQKDGTAVKFVTCEKCTTEYVYVMERQAIGVGNSMYLMKNAEAEATALSSADESLRTMLEVDFDPIPCPQCGQYQKSMFSKLTGSKGVWTQFAMSGLLILSSLFTVSALYWTILYFSNPFPRAFQNMLLTWSLLAIFVVCGFGLKALKSYYLRHDDPNTQPLAERLALANSRAVTRDEFEARRQTEKSAQVREGVDATSPTQAGTHDSDIPKTDAY